MKSGRMPKYGEVRHDPLEPHGGSARNSHSRRLTRHLLPSEYRKQDAPWLATEEFGPDDPGAPLTLSEFRQLAWEAANEAARQLGWTKSYEELHRVAKKNELRA